MTKILESGDCGNSPKNKFVQNIAISLEIGEIHSEAFGSDVAWHGITDEPIEGMKAVQQQLADQPKPSVIVVEHAISHGKVGAASGEVTLADGHKKRFCHVLEFTNTKANCVAAIQSYN